MIRTGENRKSAWRARLIQATLFFLLIFLVGLWQSRDNLSSGTLAPSYTLPTLYSGEPLTVPAAGKPTLVYLFAPWCGVCEMSASNLNWLRHLRSTESLDIVAVALDYEDRASVEAFVKKSGLEVPVILGTDDMRDAYHISAYPTYYVIGDSGQVRSVSVGYSTFIGMALRSLWW